MFINYYWITSITRQTWNKLTGENDKMIMKVMTFLLNELVGGVEKVVTKKPTSPVCVQAFVALSCKGQQIIK